MDSRGVSWLTFLVDKTAHLGKFLGLGEPADTLLVDSIKTVRVVPTRPPSRPGLPPGETPSVLRNQGRVYPRITVGKSPRPFETVVYGGHRRVDLTKERTRQ